jgi:20S proteasome alpha/beta subunit
MTVCIAGLFSKHIVTIYDSKISLPNFSGDYLMQKADPIHPNWVAMVAGEDITAAVPIWNRVRKKLGFEVSTGAPKPEEKSLEEVVRAFIASFQEYRKQEIEDRFLTQHNLTVERFTNEGKKLLGISLFTNVWNQTTSFEVKCNFLVAGFDKQKGAHLFTIEDPGIYANYDSPGFWAIGSGQEQALSSIFSAEVSANPTFETLMYDLCAAKFMAESTDGVGKATNVLVHEFGQHPKFYDDTAMEKLREIWEKEGKPRRPAKAEELVKSLLLHPMRPLSE